MVDEHGRRSDNDCGTQVYGLEIKKGSWGSSADVRQQQECVSRKSPLRSSSIVIERGKNGLQKQPHCEARVRLELKHFIFSSLNDLRNSLGIP